MLIVSTLVVLLGLPSPTPRVIGGDTIQPYQYTFLVRIYDRMVSSNSGFCGGAMITDEWIITAAHCLANREASNIVVGIHRHTIWSGATDEHACAELVDVAQKTCHPSYNNERVDLGYDICLLKLQTRVSCPDQVVKARIDDGTFWPWSVPPPYGDGDAVIVGWGTTDQYGASGSTPTYPQAGTVKLYYEAQCTSYFVQPPQVCAPEGSLVRSYRVCFHLVKS